MSYDIEAIRARISMRDLFERAGVAEFRKVGPSYVCRCPFHEEKTASCHVHEHQFRFYCFGCAAKGDPFEFWGRVRGITFVEAIAELAVVAGVSPGVDSFVVTPRKEAKAQPDWFPLPLMGDALSKWNAGVTRLSNDPRKQAELAEWRGFRLEFVEWLNRRGLVGLVPYYGVQRVAFAVQCPLPGVDELATVGVHVRLEPNSAGNPHPKQSWRYTPARSEELPNGVGAWPFVVGDIRKANIWFITEGQWDACALIDLMEWDKSWPPRVAVIGLRGATSWPLLLRSCEFPKGLICFAIADADAAGNEWWAAGGFLEQLEAKAEKVCPHRPSAPGCKDLNDVTKAGLVTKEALHEEFLSQIRPPDGYNTRRRPQKKESFFVWCRRQARGTGGLANACGFVLAMPNRPRGSHTLPVWVSRWEDLGVDGAALKALEEAFLEWGATL
jgi:hypothetical protein